MLNSSITESQPLKPAHNKGGKRVKVSEQKKQHIINDYINNPSLSPNDIAKINDVSRPFVSILLKEHNITREDVDSFKENEATLLNALRYRILKSITDEEIKKTPMVQRMAAYGIAFDKYRLDTGQSDSNVSVLVSGITEARRRKAVDNSTYQPIVRDNVIEHKDK
jgi:hypothetical protein